jgi:hypothetical protein
MKIAKNGDFTAIMTRTVASTVTPNPSAWISQSDQFFRGEVSAKSFVTKVVDGFYGGMSLLRRNL